MNCDFILAKSSHGKNLQHCPCTHNRLDQCFSLVKLSYVNSVVLLDNAHTDVPVCMAFLVILLLLKKVRGRGRVLICYFGRGVGAY